MAEIAAYRARSKEGHAAMSMKGDRTDRWVEIQRNTFTNWMNEQLRQADTSIEDLKTDLCDGVKLCRLIEVLREERIPKVIAKPINQHQSLENVTLALNAVSNDNVRLVNIGNEDVVNSNLKLIMGLIWHLILRYQIGKTKFPAKRLMLAWLQAVIPECNISNFTKDWNDGVALHALIDYCQPGLCPNWRTLNRSDRVNNCRDAMTLAKQHFDIPLVLRPEDLSSDDLDELSGMTYLSYYMKVDSPGYHATMRGVRNILRGGDITNFTTDWADGRLLSNIVRSLGESMPAATGDHITDIENGLEGGRRLAVEPLLSAKDFSETAQTEEDHIGIMAYAANFTRLTPVRSFAEKVVLESQPTNSFVGNECSFRIHLEDPDVTPGDIRAEVVGPDSTQSVRFDWLDRSAEGTFTPTETGHHKLKIYCENEAIAGSPASFKVSADMSKVALLPIDACAIGTMIELKVNSAGAGQGDVRIEAHAPSGRTHNLSAVFRNDTYIANFTPEEIGDYDIIATYNGEHIGSGQQTVNSFDPSAVRVHGLEDGSVGSAVTFHADSQNAGQGVLRCDVAYQGKQIPSYIAVESDGEHKVEFDPQGAGIYNVHVFYNDIEVKGSPYNVDIVDSSMVSVSGEGLTLVPVNKTASFNVNTPGGGAGKVDVDITAPSGRSVPCNSSQTGQGLQVQYTPTEIGDHQIEVKYSGHYVTGSPCVAKSYDTGAIDVTPMKSTIVGNPVEFFIDVSRAGEGQLEIMVNDGTLPNTVDSERQGVYRITFVPERAGKQYVEIHFNSESLPGSPFNCMAVNTASTSVRGMPDKIPIRKMSSFTIHTEGEIDADLNAVVDIYSPNAEHIHSQIQPQSDGNYKVEWTPVVAGRHTVEVQYAGSPVDGSPFSVDVFDLSAIRVDGLRKGAVGEEAGFNVEHLPWNVDFSSVGSMQNQIRIVSPSGRGLDYNMHDIGYLKKEITYIPKESGTHEIFITFAGYDLPGCPYIQHIDDGGSVVAQGDGLYHGEEDKPAVFYVDTGRRKGNLELKVDGPNSMPKYSIEPQSDGSFTVTYIPVEVGIFDISVIWNGHEIQGSPFHPCVVDPRKVRVIDGWHHYLDSKDRINLAVHEEKQLPFDVSEAGPGKLRAEVAGVSHSIPMTVDDHTFGKSTIIFTPEEEGNHYIHIFWSDIPIADSPFRGFAIGVQHNKVVLTGRGLKEAVIREEAEFVIDGSNAGPGEPQVTLQGFKAAVMVSVLPLGAGRFRCNYIPSVPGAYLLHIKWNGRQLRGTPYKVNVTGAFYHNKVMVTGEGLKGTVLGRDMDVQIDTRKAGPGELTASCTGPHKAAYCELEDYEDGSFRLSIKPQEAGKHLLQIKYGGEHVIGSPFILRVSQQPDANKVRVTGPGVEHGILATFQSRFIVETRGAGSGQLTVRIRGPKGAFQVEMYRDSQRDRTILCRYDPTETGLYIVNVKWSDVDVPGSPFNVQIVDTQHELEQVLQDASFSGSPLTTPRTATYNQWQEDM